MSKKLLTFLVLAIAIFGLGTYLFTKNGKAIDDAELPKVEPGEVEVSPESYDLGKIIMKDGFVFREYEIKNSSKNTLRVKNIVTSCMCTKAQVIVGTKKTRFYGMEMQGAKNPNVDMDIPGETTAKLLVRFDPAAHGPQGAGPVNRSIYLTFTDPVGTREVKFIGEVILK